MLQISLTLLVAAFGVALARLAHAWRADRGIPMSRTLASTGERLAA